MKRNLISGRFRIILLSLLALTFLQCTEKKGREDSINLIALDKVIDTAMITASPGVLLKTVKTGRDLALLMDCAKSGGMPMTLFREGSVKWELSRFKYLAADIINPGKEDVLVECRPNGNPWLGSGQMIPAGKTRTIRTYIIRDVYPEYIDKKLFGMNALPGGIVKMWSGLHPDSIHTFSLAIIYPTSGIQILIKNIRGEGSIEPPAEKDLNEGYFPLVDEFGQLRHHDWPGKTRSLDELISAAETESQVMDTFQLPDDRNEYGGWLAGPQLKATGHFRTEKLDGKWWLVDPSGCLFWSHGMGTVRLDEACPVTDRNHYFTALPDSAEYPEFYEFQSYSPKGYYKGRSMQAFRQHAWNLYRKYGDNWKELCSELAHKRLHAWNMNTIGGWSDPHIFGLSKTPYTETLSSNSRRIEGSEGQWYKFPDPYDPVLSTALKADVERIRKSTTDPYCIGYFVDNELYWGDDTYIARAVVQSGPDQPAKRALADFLRKKYGTIEVLNSAWNTGYRNWDDFLNSRDASGTYPEDLRLFSALVASQYFSVIKKALSEVAPGKLYLGCRFDFHYYPAEDTTGNWAVRIAGKYCDVVSFNRYRYSAFDLAPLDADKPIMIGEWHMGALDRGMLHFSLRFAEDQANRAEMYEYYMKSCLNNPWIVGAHWFEYYDEPVLGRFDGENYNTGFLDVCDRPYPEMIKASRNIGESMYRLRMENTK